MNNKKIVMVTVTSFFPSAPFAQHPGGVHDELTPLDACQMVMDEMMARGALHVDVIMNDGTYAAQQPSKAMWCPRWQA